MHWVMKFAKQGKDLTTLSIPDISVVALAYEMLKELGFTDKLNQKPRQLNKNLKPVIEKPKKNKKIVPETFSSDDEPEKEEEVKVPEEIFEKIQDRNDDSEEDWIGPKNVDQKLAEVNKQTRTEVPNLPVSVVSNDFALQNLCLKIGIPIESVEGVQIKCIRYYLLKCYSCES